MVNCYCLFSTMSIIMVSFSLSPVEFWEPVRDLTKFWPLRGFLAPCTEIFHHLAGACMGMVLRVSLDLSSSRSSLGTTMASARPRPRRLHRRSPQRGTRRTRRSSSSCLGAGASPCAGPEHRGRNTPRAYCCGGMSTRPLPQDLFPRHARRDLRRCLATFWTTFFCAEVARLLPLRLSYSRLLALCSCTRSGLVGSTQPWLSERRPWPLARALSRQSCSSSVRCQRAHYLRYGSFCIALGFALGFAV